MKTSAFLVVNKSMVDEKCRILVGLVPVLKTGTKFGTGKMSIMILIIALF